MPIFLGLIALFTAVSVSATERRGCEPYLDLEAYGKGLEEGLLTPERLLVAQNHLVEGLSKLTLWKSKDWLVTCGNQTSYVTQMLSTIVSFYVRGLDSNGDALVAKLIPTLKGIDGLSPNANKLRAELRALAARPEIERPFGTADTIAANRPTAESVLLNLLVQFPKVGLVMGAQQIEMVKLVHQFAIPRRTDKIVYAGEGAAAVLYGVSLYAPAQSYVGLEPRPIPPEVTNLLKQVHSRLKPGYLTDESLTDLAEDGPYHAITALDAVGNDPQLVQRFRMSPVEVARQLRRMISPGGVLILLNDFGSRPYFTRQQAERAGFTVVRWDLDRTMPPGLRDVMPYPRDLMNTGELRAFVLRNGTERDLTDGFVRVKTAGGQ